VIGEIPELAVGAEHELVGVFAGRHVSVTTAEVDADAIAAIFRVPLLG
jgi:hypothetical protein